MCSFRPALTPPRSGRRAPRSIAPRNLGPPKRALPYRLSRRASTATCPSSVWALILVEERLGSRYPPKTTDDAATVGRVDLGRGTAHVLLSTTSVVAGKVAEIINRLVLGRRVVAPELRSQRCPDHVVDIVSAASPDPEAGDFRRVSLASGPLADVRLDVFAG